jgi:hypothetical protein
MKLITLISVLVLVAPLTYSQSIESELGDEAMIKKRVGIKNMVEFTDFYHNGNKTKQLEYTTYDTLMNYLSIKRYDGTGKLIFEKYFTYDSIARLKYAKDNMWNNLSGYQSTYTKYEYSPNGDYIERHFDSKGKILTTSKFYLDQDKRVIRIEILNVEGYMIAYQEAKYDKENNNVTISVYNVKNQLVNKYNRPMIFDSNSNPNKTTKYNEFGDIIYTEGDLLNNDDVCFTTEYKYDKYGNWTVRKEYKWIKDKNGELKGKEPKTFVTRRIKYYSK